MRHIITTKSYTNLLPYHISCLKSHTNLHTTLWLPKVTHRLAHHLVTAWSHTQTYTPHCDCLKSHTDLHTTLWLPKVTHKLKHHLMTLPSHKHKHHLMTAKITILWVCLKPHTNLHTTLWVFCFENTQTYAPSTKKSWYFGMICKWLWKFCYVFFWTAWTTSVCIYK